jgi:hypothetical protein
LFKVLPLVVGYWLLVTGCWRLVIPLNQEVILTAGRNFRKDFVKGEDEERMRE